MADYLQVAKMAWGGDIPSPLPGHTSSEEKMIEQFEYLNCPCCGGSGHIGDCSTAIQNLKCDLANAHLMAENLEKEATWLAKQLKVKDNCVSHGGFLLDNRTLAEWRDSARKAVKDDANA